MRFVELSRAEAAIRMLASLPEPVVSATLGILGAPSPAEQSVGPDVRRLPGRPARTFTEWVARNIAAYR